MWANQPSPSSPAPGRGSWSQQGNAFRGANRGRGGGRGAPRGGGRGGRGVGGSRGGAPPRNEGPPTKPGADQPKEKPVKVPATPVAKPTATPASKSNPPPTPSPTTQQQSSNSNKPAARPKPMSRKASEQKTPTPRMKAPSISESPVIPATLSPALSTASTTAARNGGRRKRSNAKPPSAPSRKASVSVEPSGRSKLDRPPAIVTKDMPPHLAAVPDTPSFDIKHSVDALVERVRAVAMDRPNTPGSHIDWAGDDDDSLPDLDDWGVTSSTAGTADPASSEAGASRIISPILEDTLKPLPSLDDCDHHYTNPPESQHQILQPDSVKKENDGHSEDVTCSSSATNIEGGSTVSSGSSVVPNDSSPATSPPQSNAKARLHPSLPPKPAGSFDSAVKKSWRREESVSKGKEPESASDAPSVPLVQVLPPVRINLEDHNPSSKDSSPERGLGASIHAIPGSQSAPSDITTHTVPMPYRGSHFNPTHNRAHTVGSRVPGHRHPFSPHGSSFPDHASSDGERPRRGDHAHHARTQSTPPSGPGMHPRAPHATRPVITVDAISKLARTLGQTPLRREAVPAATTSDTTKE